MFRLLVLLLLFGSALAEDRVTADQVRLDVRPVLCILDARTAACDMAFLVLWQSEVETSYCLFSELAADALRCWQEAAAGRHEERRLVERTFRFWLAADAAGEPLAAVTVEVMTTETNDRRRKRRTRHVWDIL